MRFPGQANICQVVAGPGKKSFVFDPQHKYSPFLTLGRVISRPVTNQTVGGYFELSQGSILGLHTPRHHGLHVLIYAEVVCRCSMRILAYTKPGILVQPL